MPVSKKLLSCAKEEEAGVVDEESGKGLLPDGVLSRLISDPGAEEVEVEEARASTRAWLLLLARRSDSRGT